MPDSKRSENRVRGLKVSADFLVEMCKVGWEGVCKVIENGLPADATIVSTIGAGFTILGTFEVILVIHSEEFSPLSEGAELPLLPAIVWQRTDSEGLRLDFPAGHALMKA